jgi:hypothetical protein
LDFFRKIKISGNKRKIVSSMLSNINLTITRSVEEPGP